MKKIVLVFFLILFLALALFSSSFLTPKKAPSAPAEPSPAAQEVFAVSAGELIDGFLKPVSSLERGTAGSSLKEAIGAMKVLSFAVSSGIQRSDASVLKNNLLNAWNTLNVEEQERFAENYPSLSWLLDSCISDFSSYNGLFDDAGVLQEMEAVMKNPDAPSAWQILRDATEAASFLPKQ